MAALIHRVVTALWIRAIFSTRANMIAASLKILMALRILVVNKMIRLILRSEVRLRIMSVGAVWHLWSIVRLLILLYLMHLLLLARKLIT